jgi:hypothetical protein
MKRPEEGELSLEHAADVIIKATTINEDATQAAHEST